MTKADVSKAFAVFRLAYPSADMFRASTSEELRRKLDATTALWATCLADIKPRAAEVAAIELCKTLKFFPSIAEFREAALREQDRIKIISAEEQWERHLRREHQRLLERQAAKSLDGDDQKLLTEGK